LIFVLTDGWYISRWKLQDELESFNQLSSPEQALLQISWLFRNSGASCVTTSICSATSFLVNLGSVLLPLREFGLFMGLCVLCVLLLQLTMYPLAMVYLGRSRCAPRQTDLTPVDPAQAASELRSEFAKRDSLQMTKDSAELRRLSSNSKSRDSRTRPGKVRSKLSVFMLAR
jgi:hypothetical protein